MPMDWTQISSNKPQAYGRAIIRACEILHPPVDEQIIAHFLGNKVEEIPPHDDVEARLMWPKISNIFTKASAHLFKQFSLIMVNRDQPTVKKRMDVFHECGHDVLPWHENMDFSCVDTIGNTLTHRYVEQEAFCCGQELLFPTTMFLDDSINLSFTKRSLQSLALRYNASMEATAIKFAQSYQGLSAVVVAELAPEQSQKHDQWLPLFEKRINTLPPSGTDRWLSKSTFNGKPLTAEIGYPMQVKYSVTSNRFPKKFIAPGTPIPETSDIYKTFITENAWQGILPATDLGASHTRPPYFAECFTFGFNGKRNVMALLWMTDHELKFWNK